MEVVSLQSREGAFEMPGHVEMWSAGEVELRVHIVPDNAFPMTHGLELHEAILGDEGRASELDGDGIGGRRTRRWYSSGLGL